MFYEDCVNGRDVVLGQAGLDDVAVSPPCPIEAPHLRSSTFELLSENLHREIWACGVS
jgi:hypothetical protein